MWRSGHAKKPKKELAMARTIKRGPPTVSAPRIPLPNPQFARCNFLSPTHLCTVCCILDCSDGKLGASGLVHCFVHPHSMCHCKVS